MKDKLITILIIILVLVIAFGVILLKPKADITEKEAECIGENSVMYSQTGCSHCEKQEDLFGDNVRYLNIIDCVKEIEKCDGIEATPTWIIKNRSYTGVQSINKLKELTGC